MAESCAAIDYEARYRGQMLFVDTDGRLKAWGLPSKRAEVRAAVQGREAEMIKFLTARAMRNWSEAV